MAPTRRDTTSAAAMKARKRIQGDMPAAFITMISESFDILLRTCVTAMSSAIGAITKTSSGMIRPVMPMNTRIVWPWLVMMSMSRRACVTQMTAVKLSNTTRNAPKVVRKMYWVIDPIRGIVPRSGTDRTPRAASPPDAKQFELKSQPRQLYPDRSTKWPGKGKAVEHAQQNVNAARLDAKKTVGCRPPNSSRKPLFWAVISWQKTASDQLPFAAAVPGRHMAKKARPADFFPKRNLRDD